ISGGKGDRPLPSTRARMVASSSFSTAVDIGLTPAISGQAPFASISGDAHVREDLRRWPSISAGIRGTAFRAPARNGMDRVTPSLQDIKKIEHISPVVIIRR